ncbi:MAG: hypothetical protein AB1522_06080 [Chloroflexota bacterium]
MQSDKNSGLAVNREQAEKYGSENGGAALYYVMMKYLLPPKERLHPAPDVLKALSELPFVDH